MRVLLVFCLFITVCLADIGEKMTERCPKCVETARKLDKSCSKIEGSACEYSRGAIYYIHSKKDAFKKGYVYSSKGYLSKRCLNKGRILDLYHHGKGGSYVGRLHDEYREDDCRISFAPKYNTTSSYYDYSKLSNIKISEQKEVLTDYISQIVTTLEETLCTKFKEITISGHSQGGVMLSIYAKNFPLGIINIKGRKLRIKGYFAADSMYFQNLEYFNVYFLNRLKYEAVTGNKSEVKNEVISRYMKRISKDDKYKKVDIEKMIEDIYERTVNALPKNGLKELKLPLYYGSALDTMWVHQKALYDFVANVQGPVCGFFGARMVRYDYSNSNYWGTKIWEKRKKTTDSSYHWIASGKFIRDALDYFDNVKSETYDCY